MEGSKVNCAGFANEFIDSFTIHHSPMQRSTPIKEGRHSDPSTSSLTPLRSDFLSAAASTRSHSLSPRKRLVKQPLHIRMNLTETQMDKLTDAFSHKVATTPNRPRNRANMVTPKTTPKRSKTPKSQPEQPYGCVSSEEDTTGLDSPTFSELMPGRQHHANKGSFSSSLAGRRQRVPPAPIQTEGGRSYYNIPHRVEMEPVSDPVSPLAQGQFRDSQYTNEDSASVYSQDPRFSRYPEPLYTLENHHARSQSKISNSGMGTLKDWTGAYSPPKREEATPRQEPLLNRPRRSKSNAEGLRQAHFAEEHLHPPPQQFAVAVPPTEDLLFSPLQFYFRGNDFPTAKKGEKTMIGDNGWLERTEKLQEIPKKSSQKKAGILDSIKKIAKDMADLSHNARRPQQQIKERRTSQVAISLNAREQSLFYCELEFHLGNALNEYITIQLDKGRLVPDKLKKVADAWTQKGRPKVVGFRYDLETQLELVNLHIEEFRFYGRRQGDPIEIAGLLHAMKVNARAMSIRTFCQPDSVVAKQLVDSQSLFKLIGVPDAQQIALAEIAQFFKVIVERELDGREQRGYENRKTTTTQGQSDRSWQE